MPSTDLLEQNYYPLQLEFKIATFHNDFTATDALGNVRAYAKQKLFKLKEHVQIFTDDSQTSIKYASVQTNGLILILLIPLRMHPETIWEEWFAKAGVLCGKRITWCLMRKTSKTWK